MESPQIIKVKAMCVIVRKDSEILANRSKDPLTGEAFTRLIGGSIEFGETAEEALRREFKEELGAELEHVSLVKVIENRFVYNGQPGHEIVFIFKGDFADKSLYDKESIPRIDKDGEAGWISLASVRAGKEKLYPEFDYASVLKQ